jgi:hypothetical protein
MNEKSTLDADLISKTILVRSDIETKISVKRTAGPNL